METLSPITLGFLGSLAAGSLTAIGAIPVLFGRIPSRPTRDLALGFAAGVMLAASFFSLIIPALDAAEPQFESGAAPAAIVCVAILLGMGAVALMNELLPHEHFKTGREGADAGHLARIWLFVIAITIHNFPEGLSIGVAFGGDTAKGLSVMTGISIQDMPEGLAVAVSMIGLGYSRLKAFLVTAATGLVEVLGGFLGAWAVSLSGQLLPWGLTFAAGAMLFIISHEIVPETHRHGHQDKATLGFIVGLVLMMFLDVTLG